MIVSEKREKLSIILNITTTNSMKIILGRNLVKNVTAETNNTDNLSRRYHAFNV